MPEQDNKSSPLLDIRTTAVLMALVLAGTTIIQAPYRSSRPDEKRPLEGALLGDQMIPARLWQDPLQAAQDYHSQHPDQKGDNPGRARGTNPGSSPSSLGELSQQVARRCRHQAPVTILEVMTSGGAYAEDSEVRQRARYAVLSAIGVAGYVPLDAEHLGFAQRSWPRGEELENEPFPTQATTKAGRENLLIIPFEWFGPNELEPARTTNGDLLVLWLNDAEFVDHPLQRLALINDEIRRRTQEANPSPPASLNFKLLEPRLPPMLSELERLQKTTRPGSKPAPPPALAALNHLEFYSSWSTTPDALLALEGRSAFAHPPGCGPWTFTRVTSTDDQLAEELIDELELRDIDVTQPKNLVLLISEWDTFYGRALPLTFAAMVKYRMNDHFTPRSFCDSTHLFGRLKNAADPASSGIRPWLSRAVRRQLEQPSPSANFAELLAKDFDRLLQSDLRGWAHHLPGGTNPAFGLLKDTEDIRSAARRTRLNRALLETAFAGDITTNSFAATVRELRQNTNAWPANIIRRTYVRGIDGKLSGEKADASPEPGANKQTKDDTRNDQDTPAPRPEGHGQLDYMPRLADGLVRLESLLQSKDGKEFKAIGVLGSDVYDKLLVLQALRRQFTDEIFFTTDLDARLLHPSALKWTRNVLVASSFGLQLVWTLQQETPPFRDTYQTGQYLGCLAALDYPGVRANLANLGPRRFEIGRNGAYDLSPRGISPIHPPIPRLSNWTWRAWGKGFWRGLLAVMVITSAVLLSPPVRRAFVPFVAVATCWPSPGPKPTAGVQAKSSEPSSEQILARLPPPPKPFDRIKSWWTFRLCVATPVLLGLLVGGCILWDHHLDPDGEPFSIASGISIWPTELLRLVAACLAVYFLFRAYSTLVDNKSELCAELGSDANEQQATAAGSSTSGRLWDDVLLNWKIDFEKDSGQTPAKTQVYNEYGRLGTLRQRGTRVVLSGICYLLLIWVLWQVFDRPFQPFRGVLSRRVDCFLEVLSYVALVLLVFFVADAARLCGKFIDQLRATDSQWPPYFAPRLRRGKPFNSECLDSLIDLRVIAVRSAAVGELILYPFFVLFLMLVARNDFFDRWDWPPSLLLFFGLNSAYAAYVVWALRRAAENAREALLKKLKQKLLAALARPQDGLVQQLQQLIQQVESCQEGAFAPITQQPVIKALLMPFGGAGVLGLLNYLAGKA